MLYSLIFSILLAAPSENQILAIGESHAVASQPLQSVRIQKKGILSIKDLGNQLVFTGKKLGTTQVHLGSRSIQFQVIHRKKYRSLNQLQQWIKGKRGPRIEINQEQIQIKGRLLSLVDFKELPLFVNESLSFQTGTQMSHPLRQQVQEHLNTLIKNHNLPVVQWVFQPTLKALISKSVKNSTDLYKKILSPYGVTVQFDPQAIARKPVIKIRVYVAHVTKNFLRSWGLQWPSQWKAQIVPQQNLKLQDLELSLHSLEQKGWGQVLATPTLVTESGQEAEFHSGGEFPVRTTTQFNNSLQWKPYGLFFKTTPTTNAQGQLHIKVSMEVSSLDHSQSVEGVPALIKNHVKTQINMERPQPFLLSGFLQQSQKDTQEGLPWLSQIPIFKPLFSNGQIYNSELELVFVMIPEFYHE